MEYKPEREREREREREHTDRIAKYVHKPIMRKTWRGVAGHGCCCCYYYTAAIRKELLLSLSPVEQTNHLLFVFLATLLFCLFSPQISSLFSLLLLLLLLCIVLSFFLSVRMLLLLLLGSIRVIRAASLYHHHKELGFSLRLKSIKTTFQRMQASSIIGAK